ncbi:MAG: cytochrome c [Bacteroidota bacterium]
MRTQLFLSALTGFLIASCSTKKPTTVTETSIPKENIKQEIVLTPELMEGKTLYENSCVKCHKLYDPKEYSQEDWAPILIRMQKKAHLDDAQITSISHYINSQL